MQEAIDDGDYEERPEIPELPGEGGEKPDTQVPPGRPAPGSRLVERIYSDAAGVNFLFEYDDDGRLTKLINADWDYVGFSLNTVFSYHRLDGVEIYHEVLVEKVSSSGLTVEEIETMHYSLNLGTNGYLVSGTEKEEGSPANHWNANDYMTESTWDDFGYELTWTDGNMTKLYSGEGEDYTTYQYGVVENNPLCNIDLNWLIGDMDFAPLGGLIRLMGKPSAKLVSVMSLHSSESPTTYVTNITYTTDAEGYVTEITATTTNGDQTVLTVVYL